MKKLITILSIIGLLATNTNAQNSNKAYSEKVRVNASTFHKNFSSGDFDKNGPLVNDKIYVNSNTAIVIGKENFVNRIKRFNTPFPGLKLRDRIVIVDENEVGLLYIMQDTHNGPYGAIPASGNKINVYAAEFFTMDEDAKMKELLTITQLNHLVKQIKGEEKVETFEPVSLLPIKKTGSTYKQILKNNVESYVQNFNVRSWVELNNLLDENVKVNWNGKIGTGKQAVIDGLNLYTTLLPDLSFHLDRNVVEGDRGALAYTMIGTFTNNSKTDADGKPMTKRIEAKEAVHFQFNAVGKIIELVVVSNTDDVSNQAK